jgi:hypothetical protein
MRGRDDDWKRFWCPRESSINLSDGGYLADPDGPYGSYLNPTLRPFGEVAELSCLALLGEPDIDKTETLRAERAAIDSAVLAERAGRFGWTYAPAAASNSSMPSYLGARSSLPGRREITAFTSSSSAWTSACFRWIPWRPARRRAPKLSR